MGKTVAVIGAGVIGLTTAILALDAGYTVTIYSDKSTDETTSAKAAASFKPQSVAYNDLTQEMVEISWKYFEEIFAKYSKIAGVDKQIHWEATNAEKKEAPYIRVVEDFETVKYPDVPGGYAFAWKYRTFFIDTSIFLPWLLRDRFAARGGLLKTKRFTGLEQLAELPADVIFNCTGLGARELCNDRAVRPIKGQIVIIDPQPNMTWSINADGFYVYPRKNDTVLGGTTEWDVDNEIVEGGTVDRILRENKRILHDLNENLIKRKYAGLRPYRDGTIRLESQNVNGKQIVHNYGHGGAGYTLCWGSAHLALKQI